MSYTFEVRENVKGRPRPVAMGAVTVTDPDGDERRIGCCRGGGERFAVAAEDGAVTDLGSGEDAGTEANRYELTVRACDPLGAEARAQVVVEVTSLNELSTVRIRSSARSHYRPFLRRAARSSGKWPSISQNSHLAVSVSHT